MKMKVSICISMALLFIVMATALVATAQTAPPPTPAPTPAAPVDLVATLTNSPDHKTLVSLITAAGLVDTLQQPGPYTVFAPSDAAFAKVPKATMDKLSMPENKDMLKALLLYHVVKGTITKKDLLAMASPSMLETLNTASVTITHNTKSVKVNKVKISAYDMMASNGVIQVIDTVLMPPKK